MGSPVLIDQGPSPFDSLVALAAGYFGQRGQNQRADEQEQYQRQQDALTRQDRLTAEQQAQQNWQQNFGLQQKQFGLDQQRTQSDLQTAAQNRRIAQAAAEFEAKMRPLYKLQAQGQINAQQLQNALDKFNLHLKQKYGETEAQIGIQQGIANVAATVTNTAATSQRTQQDAALFPGELQGQRLRNFGQAIDNLTGAQQLNQLGNGPGFFGQPTTAEEQEYRQRVALWKAANKGKTLDDPSAPISPDDFRATVDQVVEKIQELHKQGASVMGGGFGGGFGAHVGGTPFAQVIEQTVRGIRADTRMSARQKQLAEQAIRAAAAGHGMPGGSSAAGPFLQALGL